MLAKGACGKLHRVKLIPLFLGTLLAVTLTGCGGDDKPKVTEPTAPPSSLPAAVGTVQGQLKLSGGPSGARFPAPGKLTISGNGSTLHADLGKDGKFAIQLAPGRYRISATSPNFYDNAATCRTSPSTTVIVAGKTVTADMVCSMP